MGSASRVLFIYVLAHLLCFMGSTTSSTHTVVRSEFDDVNGVVEESDEMTISTMMRDTLSTRRFAASPTPGQAPSPSPAPGPQPHLPTRSLVAVQGVVYCKPCKYQGVGTLLGATPLSGAVVRMVCNNSKTPLREETKTDKNGYFFLQASKNITNFGAHKCKMFLVSSPLKTCDKPTDLHMGLSGSSLIRERKQPPSLSTSPTPYTLYSTLGPFAFDPTTCPHH